MTAALREIRISKGPRKPRPTPNLRQDRWTSGGATGQPVNTGITAADRRDPCNTAGRGIPRP
jgi:hypothetical protein